MLWFGAPFTTFGQETEQAVFLQSQSPSQGKMIGRLRKKNNICCI